MAIETIDNRSAVIGTRGWLARTAVLRTAIALGTVWSARLATTVDWGSPNLGTGMAFAAAASAVRLLAAKVPRRRTLRFLAGPALALGVIAALLGPGVWSAAMLSAQVRGSLATGGLGATPVSASQSATGGGLPVAPSPTTSGRIAWAGLGGQVSPALASYFTPQPDGPAYRIAVDRSIGAAPITVAAGWSATGAPITSSLTTGPSILWSDQAPTTTQLREMVSAGKLRFVISGGQGGGSGGPGGEPDSAQWLAVNLLPIDPAEYGGLK